jgi:outer membrane lipoprotein SlyB
MRVMGKVFIVVTAAIASYSIINAENKPKEAIKQGAIISGGAGGGWLAGLAVSSICGSDARVCAIAVVLAGTIAGGLAAEAVTDSFDEELEEFTQWGML